MMNETSLATTESAMPFIPSTPSELMFHPVAFARMEAIAEIMASSKTTLPRHLVGSKGDCMAIVMQAAQWRMNPFSVAQKTHLVNGTLGYEAQLVNAVVTSLAPIEGRLDYEFFGPWEGVIGKFKMFTGKNDNQYAKPAWTPQDEKGCGMVVRGKLKGEAKPRELTILLSQCWPRNSTLWAYDPQQQMTYQGVKKWARRYCPDVILGVYSPDELQDHSAIDVTERAEVVDDEPPGNEDFTPRSKSEQDSRHKPAPKDQEEIQQESVEPDPDEPAITAGMLAMLQKKCQATGVDESLVAERMGVTELRSIPRSKINDALAVAADLK